MFRAMMSPAMMTALAVVRGRLTSAPMTSRRQESRISGTRAKATPNERATWEATRTLVVGRPRASTARAGSIVSARRLHNGTLRRMNPYMTTCPA